MPIIIPYHDAPQGSDKWKELRLGIPTASEFSKILTTTGKESKQRTAYLQKLAGEMVTGRVENPFELSAFKRGKEMEPVSRLHFENVYGVDVEQVSFVFHDEHRRFGCSPDGLIGNHAGFETKDANCFLQRDRLLKRTLPTEHFQQVQGSLWICERETWHYRSYCHGMRPLDIEVHRDEEWIKKLAIELTLFCNELDKLVYQLKAA